MRLRVLFLVPLLIAPATGALAQDPSEPPTADAGQAAAATEERAAAGESDIPAASYGLGLQMGRNFKYQQFEVDVDLLLEGIKDGLAGGQPRFEVAKMQAAIKAAEVEAARAISARNRALGEAYLTANVLRPGVFTLPSGLQYEVLVATEGAKPTTADSVVVRYRTSLVDGTLIEDTFGADQPRTVPVSSLIPGWTEAIQRMSVGSRWRLWVPPDLAHGDQGSGAIGPGVTTVFVIELIDILAPGPADPELSQ